PLNRDAVIGAANTRITDAPLLSSSDGQSTCSLTRTDKGAPPALSTPLRVCAGLSCWSISTEEIITILIIYTLICQGLIQRTAPDSRLQLHGKDAGAAPDVPALHLLLSALRSQQGTETLDSSPLHGSLCSLFSSVAL
ncbi:hypothetical protein M9458_039016, partial [Cirrhinus mrigala]